MATVRDIVQSALREIGVLAASETATAEDAAVGMERLNMFIDRLATERLAVYAVTSFGSLLSSGTSSYLIGPTGDIVTKRPIHIVQVNGADTSVTPSIEYPLTEMTEEAYASLSPKNFSASRPSAWYYRRDFDVDGNATIIFWPVPDNATVRVIGYYWDQVSEFSALTETVALPPGYREMLVTNLGLLLCSTFERQPNPALVKAATDSMSSIKRANLRLQDLSFEAAALIGNSPRYDIRTG